MRTSFLITCASALTFALSLAGTGAHAQRMAGSQLAYASARPIDGRGAAVSKAAGSNATAVAPSAVAAARVVNGHVMSPAGALAGAVVEVAGTTEAAVTNANGEFSITLPANDRPVQLVASYAGFADETMTIASANQPAMLKLSTAQPVTCTIARRQQLKAYLKTAHRQARRSLRKIS